MTKFLPKEYKDVVQYVEINGRTKIAIKGQISNYIPNPTFSVVAQPGAWEEYFKFGNPDGKSKRELFGEPMRAIPAFFEPGRAWRRWTSWASTARSCSRRWPASSRSG